jgi:cation diffusion facilitator CzcD-associated flavoprotein CzcO
MNGLPIPTGLNCELQDLIVEEGNLLTLDCSYASQPEILQYFRDTAKNFDLEKYIAYSTEVIEARWNEGKAQWAIQTRDRKNGEVTTDWCDFFINGGGFLK